MPLNHFFFILIGLQKLIKMKKDSALYIHIPFCNHKCIYCDFYSIITSDNIAPFIEAVKKEIENYSKLYSSGRSFSSIFFGGGTPSLLDVKNIQSIIESLKNNFDVEDDAEITLETNPGTVNIKKLKYFKEIGINRISAGVQSFHEDDLKFLTRIHNRRTAIETVYNVIESGIDNLNIDLIFNLPGQTKKRWLQNLDQAVKLPVKHISAYSLILERGTILNKMVLDGKVKIQDEDYDAELYQITIDFFEQHGFMQYEVSNFAKPGFECRHNNAYWQYHEYISFGPSVHSFVENKRWWNFSSLKKYINEIDKSGNARAGYEEISYEQKRDEYIMLALRSSGININKMKKIFGDGWLNDKNCYIKTLADENFLVYNEDRIKLTKKGYAVCDEILSKIL